MSTVFTHATAALTVTLEGLGNLRGLRGANLKDEKPLASPRSRPSMGEHAAPAPTSIHT